MGKKRMIVCAVLAAVFLFVAWMLWPRSLAGPFDGVEQLNAIVIRSGVENGHPWINSTEDYHLEADSDQGAAILAVLEQHSYHLCLGTLIRADVIQDTGDLEVKLFGDWETDLTVSVGTGKMFLNGRVVRVDYLGSGEAKALCEELLTVLRGT